MPARTYEVYYRKDRDDLSQPHAITVTLHASHVKVATVIAESPDVVFWIMQADCLTPEHAAALASRGNFRNMTVGDVLLRRDGVLLVRDRDGWSQQRSSRMHNASRTRSRRPAFTETIRSFFTASFLAAVGKHLLRITCHEDRWHRDVS